MVRSDVGGDRVRQVTAKPSLRFSPVNVSMSPT